MKKDWKLFVAFILIVIMMVICYGGPYIIESFEEYTKVCAKAYPNTHTSILFEEAESIKSLGNNWFSFSYQGHNFLYHRGYNNFNHECIIKIE